MTAPLVLEDICRAFGRPPRRRDVLRGVSLRIRAGALVALVGPSGSGKTTLLRVAGTLDRPDAGSVHLSGVNVLSASTSELERLRRRDLAFVFQAGNLLDSLTAAENVELALEGLGLDWRERQRRVDEALGRLDVSRTAHRFPGELSAGEQQRVAVARALARRAPLILCDEPTAHLDEAAARSLVQALLETCSSGASCLLATHDLHVVTKAHRLLRLRDGMLVEGESEDARASTTS